MMRYEARRSFPSVVPAKRNASPTHTARSFRFGDTVDAPSQQITPVVMGPCFRRDDGESYPDRASAPSIIVTAFARP
jgi:hypothetical protein